MKSRKKHQGMKAEIRARRKRSRYIAIVVAVTILVAIIVIALIYSYQKTPSNQTPAIQLKAAIVDQLSLTVPNQTFIEKATFILETANFTVDYYPGENVTVEFYRNLPTHGYSLIVLRVHSGLMEGKYPPLCLFTSERYIQWKYGLEELDDKVTSVAYSEEEAEKGIAYFGITPKFVQYSMKGTFQDVIIIMMGCNGLTYTQMAQAFTENKGAKVYIGWNLAVSASHTDQATIRLLEHLITERQKIKQAVTETMNEVGPDPVDESILLYYPTTPETENYVIPGPKIDLTINIAEIWKAQRQVLSGA